MGKSTVDFHTIGDQLNCVTEGLLDESDKEDSDTPLRKGSEFVRNEKKMSEAVSFLRASPIG